MAGEIKRYSSPLPTAANAKDAASLEFVQELTTNAAKVQEELLVEILSANKDTEYLWSFGLSGATDRATFKAKVPVIEYDQVKPYARRIAHGDRSAVLTAEPITEFLISSGTTGGERKLIPETKAHFDCRFVFEGAIQALINSCIPDEEEDKAKRLNFFFSSSETRTPSGLIVRQGSTTLLKSHYAPLFVQNLTSPIEALLCLDHFQSMYVQMLCGLLRRDVVRSVGALYAHGLLLAIRFLQLHYQELARDISTGSLSPTITDASLRAAVSHLMRPNPALGELLLSECSTGNWDGIVRRIWPGAKFLGTVVTGTNVLYVPDLERFGGGLPMVSTAYGSSEGHFGVNLKPVCEPSEVVYTIMPNMGYFEFLPLDPEEGGECGELRPVDYTEVKVGKEYEIVVTTTAGLYRYRMGDVVKVTGFHNAAPQVRIMKRRNQVLSVRSETTDEVELQRGVDKASRLLEEFETSIVEYTGYVDVKTIPGHYVIYMELLYKDSYKRPSGEAMERCCMAMEEELDGIYRQSRGEEVVGALEIKVVRDGTFDELMALAVSGGTSASQYKVPRCVNSTPALEVLESRVTASYFSPEAPSWDWPDLNA